MPVLIRERQYTLADLLLHRAPMLLLEDVVAHDATSCRTVLTIREDNLFLQAAEPPYVPAYVGIEYMAQTIAVWAGIQSALLDEATPMGFLLGTRKYRTEVAGFSLGQWLSVTATLNYQQDALSVFTCTIANELATLAEANITVFQPDDADAYLRAAVAAQLRDTGVDG